MDNDLMLAAYDDHHASQVATPRPLPLLDFPHRISVTDNVQSNPDKPLEDSHPLLYVR